VALTLRDRIRRWWKPAQWEDDHPAERKQRERPKKTRWITPSTQVDEDVANLGPSGRMEHERDFKKPR
jgi:hypothetical protein